MRPRNSWTYSLGEVPVSEMLQVLAINAVTFWHALRNNGIADRIPGFGSLLAEH